MNFTRLTKQIFLCVMAFFVIPLSAFSMGAEDTREETLQKIMKLTEGYKVPDMLTKPKTVKDLGDQVFSSRGVWGVVGTSNCYILDNPRFLSSTSEQDERGIPFAQGYPFADGRCANTRSTCSKL
ncbi:MAG: hypothetical protein B7Y25_06850 [Alphaproteobacteria bacterium 16-39-46]|nr:MAG: hypothetical protein B7Y25_06850 [Alphaproteobacteria bacterium 16-39-46]OZA42076.1 MAG: hypothetical protein B7X84_07015 [Alphaproteobacteria bacterium 17-39-52]HQS84608.1 hypothetical protein [Alphaproteobacteria bacterium]HQS94412.1 hypothetical protein [Alphaproteobacteria bacterium]